MPQSEAAIKPVASTLPPIINASARHITFMTNDADPVRFLFIAAQYTKYHIVLSIFFLSRPQASLKVKKLLKFIGFSNTGGNSTKSGDLSSALRIKFCREAAAGAIHFTRQVIVYIFTKIISRPDGRVSWEGPQQAK